ncbi:MAG: hypothetical protein IKZ61_05090 [Prevotella sp.]|nr:hypothetical protein [Prevotella sp.]MBR4925113.1 hypothetical protein [Prevotella sp.]
MNLLTAIVKSKRPSRIKDMPASVNSFLCRKGYSGITLFGRIFTNEQGIADSLNGKYSVMKNHEMIHLRQAQSTGNNWFVYYTLYGFFWLKGICLNRRRKNLAYYLNPFEMEAYLNEHDMHYLEQFEKGATGWRQLRKMSYPQRYRLMKRLGVM